MNATYTIGQTVYSSEFGQGIVTCASKFSHTYDVAFTNGTEEGLFACDLSAEPVAIDVKVLAEPTKMSASEFANALTNALTRYKGDATRERMLNMVDQVATASKGFASEVAATVVKFERCSTKQADIIASAYVTI
jgi:hypothetical protein